MTACHPPARPVCSRSLEFKPDMPEAARRWEAFYAGDLLDRPLVCVTAPRPDAEPVPRTTYHDRVFGDLAEVVDRDVRRAAGTYYGGEAYPVAWVSFGPDEVGVFCGAEFGWSEDSGDTNWSVPCVTDWDAALPLELQTGSPLYQRLLAFYRAFADAAEGKMLLTMPDLHTNLDLLSAIRGPQALCLDLIDVPELIDQAMADARAVFPRLWDDIWEAGRLSEVGCAPAISLQCDFSCMMSPAMFRRWVLPALEEEAAIIGNAVYHWDGPGAVVHLADLVASPGLHRLDYVPGDGHGGHIDHLDLMKACQAEGKAVGVWGSVEECKAMHRELRPELTCYLTGAATPDEAEAVLEWFVKNT